MCSPWRFETKMLTECRYLTASDNIQPKLKVEIDHVLVHGIHRRISCRKTENKSYQLLAKSKYISILSAQAIRTAPVCDEIIVQ